VIKSVGCHPERSEGSGVVGSNPSPDSSVVPILSGLLQNDIVKSLPIFDHTLKDLLTLQSSQFQISRGIIYTNPQEE
jgi:hypothetical protein